MVDFKEVYKRYLSEFEKLRPKIEENTEKYRKSNASIKLTDKNGNPIKNAEIKVEQQTHDFKFGCNVLNLGQLGEYNKIYEEKIAKLFNLVTTTICWSSYEPEEGKYNFCESGEEISRRPPLDRVQKFAKENNLAFKGQPLVADSWWPKWSSKNPDELKKQYVNYFNKLSERYGKSLYLIDVVNEAYSVKERTPDFPLYTEDLSFRNWAFAEAKKAFPDNVILNYNEGSPHNSGKDAEMFFNDVKGLLDSDCGINSCSFQFHLMTMKRNGGDGAFAEHLKGNYHPLPEIYKNYEKFSTLNIPLYISEMTVTTRDDGLEREFGEKIQADVIERLYRLWFSIPKMAGIIYWNLADGHAYGGENDCFGCLLDERFFEKPSYQRLYQLIHREWKTNISDITDENGCVHFRGFNGEYKITVTDEKGTENSFSLSLGDGKQNCETFIV